jgi:hypothetical protein
MPIGKAIKSAAQFRLMEAAAHGKASTGPSKEVAAKLLSETTHDRKSNFAKMRNKKKPFEK